MRPHWVNTSSNQLIMEQFDRASYRTIQQVEQLLQGQTLEMALPDHTVFKDLERATPDTLFSFLAFSGYLNATFSQQPYDEELYTLRIPNREVNMAYRAIFGSYFKRILVAPAITQLLQDLLEGKVQPFTKMLKEYVLLAFSYWDTAESQPERIYHGFMLGLLAHLHPTHKIRSNREVGLGRADMLIIPKDPQDQRAYVLEFKRAADPGQRNAAHLEATAEEALAQITEHQYTAELLAEGRQLHQLGIAFHGKQVAVAHTAHSAGPAHR